MINVYIYLDESNNAEEIAVNIVKEKLVANASIDIDNNYYELIEGEVHKKVHVVLTVQTKALIFNELVQYIEERYGKNIPIYATPLVSANDYFDQFIRSRTHKV